MGSVCAGNLKTAFPAPGRETTPRWDEKRVVRGTEEQRPCLGGRFCLKSFALTLVVLQSARMNLKKVVSVAAGVVKLARDPPVRFCCRRSWFRIHFAGFKLAERRTHGEPTRRPV